MGQFFKAAKAADVATGKLQTVELQGRRIALFSLGDEIFALGDLRSHGAHATDRLTEAAMDRADVANVLRESRFGLGPENAETVDIIERYNVRVTDGDVEIEIGDVTGDSTGQ